MTSLAQLLLKSTLLTSAVNRTQKISCCCQLLIVLHFKCYWRPVSKLGLFSISEPWGSGNHRGSDKYRDWIGVDRSGPCSCNNKARQSGHSSCWRLSAPIHAVINQVMEMVRCLPRSRATLSREGSRGALFRRPVSILLSPSFFYPFTAPYKSRETTTFLRVLTF